MHTTFSPLLFLEGSRQTIVISRSISEQILIMPSWTTMRHSLFHSGKISRSVVRARRRHANIDAAISRSFCSATISKSPLSWTTASMCQNGNNKGFPPFSSDSRPDPFARRPTTKCDPYDQGGKPLTLDRVSALMATVEPEWEVVMTENDENDESSNHEDKTTIPFAIRRFYWHEEYLQGAEFIRHVAAVAQMNAQHFPHELTLARKLNSKTKTWNICTEVVCRTHVLQGLSGHDFYLATLIDIEAMRPELRGLIIA